MMKKIKRSDIEQTIYQYTDNIRFTYDWKDFGGLNMWNLQVKTKNGHWKSVQWMGRSKVINISGLDIPLVVDKDTG